MRFVSHLLALMTLATSGYAQYPPTPTNPAPATAEPPPPATPTPPGQGLEAGGLAPPQAVDERPSEPQNGQDATLQNLERADEEDTGRGLEFIWLNLEAGYGFVGLENLKSSDLVDGSVVRKNQSGPVFGGALGVRLFVLTFGARFRYSDLDEWRLWTLEGEAGLRVPLGMLEVYGMVGAGYASVDSFSENDFGSALNDAGIGIRGVGARVAGGVDVYLSDTFSLGANLGGDFLFLSRKAMKDADASMAPATTEGIYAKSGSGIGSGFTATAVVGIHY